MKIVRKWHCGVNWAAALRYGVSEEVSPRLPFLPFFVGAGFFCFHPSIFVVVFVLACKQAVERYFFTLRAAWWLAHVTLLCHRFPSAHYCCALVYHQVCSAVFRRRDAAQLEF